MHDIGARRLREEVTMKGGTQAALALGVGYMLGRQHKMRMAAMMAAGAATGRMGGLGGAVFRRGAKMLGSNDMLGKLSPQVTEVAETVRGDLLDAGKAAVVAALNNRIESLSDSLHERAETLRNPAAAATDAGKEAGKGAEKAARGVTRRGRRAVSDEDADVAEDEELDEPEDIEEPEDEEPADEREDERDERRAPSARRRASQASRTSRTTRRRPAVTRSGR
jgi:hypothetical protein